MSYCGATKIVTQSPSRTTSGCFRIPKENTITITATITIIATIVTIAHCHYCHYHTTTIIATTFIPSSHHHQHHHQQLHQHHNICIITTTPATIITITVTATTTTTTTHHAMHRTPGCMDAETPRQCPIAIATGEKSQSLGWFYCCIWL